MIEWQVAQTTKHHDILRANKPVLVFDNAGVKTLLRDDRSNYNTVVMWLEFGYTFLGKGVSLEYITSHEEDVAATIIFGWQGIHID